MTTEAIDPGDFRRILRSTLRPSEKLVLFWLVTNREHVKENYVSSSAIAGELQFSQSTAARCLRNLVRRGMITMTLEEGLGHDIADLDLDKLP